MWRKFHVINITLIISLTCHLVTTLKIHSHRCFVTSPQIKWSHSVAMKSPIYSASIGDFIQKTHRDNYFNHESPSDSKMKSSCAFNDNGDFTIELSNVGHLQSPWNLDSICLVSHHKVNAHDDFIIEYPNHSHMRITRRFHYNIELRQRKAPVTVTFNWCHQMKFT